MVRRPHEVCVKDSLPAGSRAAAGRLNGYKNSVDMGKHVWAVHRENPPARPAVVNREEAQIEWLTDIRFAISPCLENSMLMILPVLQIESVEDKEFLLDVIHSPVGALCSPVTRHVVNINNVEIARAE